MNSQGICAPSVSVTEIYQLIPNIEKYKQVLHYIISLIGRRKNIGKTVLYKILYFCDFDFYELYETSLTGEWYRKIQYGPAPSNFNNVVKCLEKDGLIKKKVEKGYGDYKQQKFISIKTPTVDLISEKEKEIIDAIIQKLSQMNASQISKYSHKDVPWLVAKDGEIIDYELVFYRTPEFSVRKYDDEEKTSST